MAIRSPSIDAGTIRRGACKDKRMLFLCTQPRTLF